MAIKWLYTVWCQQLTSVTGNLSLLYIHLLKLLLSATKERYHDKENGAVIEKDHQQSAIGSLAFCNGTSWLSEISVVIFIVKHTYSIGKIKVTQGEEN